jgi:hypothetical protein
MILKIGHTEEAHDQLSFMREIHAKTAKHARSFFLSALIVARTEGVNQALPLLNETLTV